MGKTNDRGPYVYLSDGGHFENTGLCELVRRSCKIIVVSDASDDAHGIFRSLGNAIERCRVDMGIVIEIEIPFEDNAIAAPVAVGKISYRDGSEGVLIYIKPTKGLSVPADVFSLFRSSKAFPHESTLDQWFSESQFEAYRALGFAIGAKVGKALRDAQGDFFSRAKAFKEAVSEEGTHKNAAKARPVAANE
jgi:hypothetical protein